MLAFLSRYPLPTSRPRCRYIHTPCAVHALRAPRTFVRLIRTPLQTVTLQTAITIYASPTSSATFHLLSLLHFADPAYYIALEKHLSPLPIHLHELQTSAQTILLTPATRLLVNPVHAPPSTARTANLLLTIPQVEALPPTHPRARIADLPSLPRRKLRLQIPFHLPALLLPCPAAWLTLSDLPNLGLTPRRAAQLVSGAARRRRLFAWRCATMPPASGVRCRAREDIAWEAVEECSSDVALLYGAAHSAAFCRRAESEGWEFVKRIWVDAMVIPDETVRLHQWLSLGGVVALVCGVAAYDWLAVLGSIIDDAPHPAVVLNVSLYFVRHIAAYLALRKWYGTWEKEEAT